MSMAETLDDGEFWLPSEFLADVDFIPQKEFTRPSLGPHKFKCSTNASMTGVFGASCDYTLGGYTKHTPPAASLSREAENDKNDFRYLADISRKLASTGLHENQTWSTKERYPSGSPQSTLCPIGSGCGCLQGTCRGSPTQCSPNALSDQATWDILYAAAGEVAKMKRNKEASYRFNPNAPDADVGRKLRYSDTGFSNYANQARSIYYKLQANASIRQQLYELQDGGRGSCIRSCRTTPVFHSSICGSGTTGQLTMHPPHHFRQDSTVRPVFLNSCAVKKQSAGTGVFLPRRNNANIPLVSESRKDAGSTVLLPARVVQALNMNLDEFRGCSPLPQHLSDAIPNPGPRFRACDLGDSLQKISYSPGNKFATEVRLPQEWTY